ncbi:MAG TPA: SMC family ATPase [Nitrolancea sp.]|nr:SMC family ATPase [Nitrolancea sp.]
MIPTSISVRNFMCYRSSVDIDLRGIRIACLSGENGAGKSALLDSITWSLWGRARVNSDRDLIALNATEMEVTFGFELQGQEFRVTRRRTRGGAGQLALDLQTLDGSVWRTISGATARETQRAIDRLLKMDYDTFINSAFILQGRADEFTTKSPSLRKQTLSDILNLSDYDRYEEIARQQLREHERSLREIDAAIERIDERLAELPERRADVERLGAELLANTEQVEVAKERVASVQQRLKLLEIAAEQRTILQQEIATLKAEITRHTTTQKTIAGRIAKNQMMVARKDEIVARHRELQSLRREHEEIGGALARRQVLLNRRRTVEREIERARHAVETQLQSARDEIARLEATVASRATVERERIKLQREIEQSAEVAARLEQVRAERSRQEARSGELAAENRQLMDDMNDLKARIAHLDQATACCPICRQPLGPGERERLRADYQVEGKEQGDRYRANRDEIRCIEAALDKSKREIQQLERQQEQRQVLARQEATLAERLAVVDRAEADLSERRGTEAALVARLASEELAAAEQAEMRSLDQQLAAIPFDETRYQQVQERLRQLAGVEEEANKLIAAESAIDSDQQQLQMIEETLADRTASLNQKIEQEATLCASLEGLQEAREEFDVLDAELTRLEGARSDVQQQLGAARQRVEDLQNLAEEREATIEQRARTAEKKAIYDELVIAFGKRGIQAMIIENVVPELEDAANRILDKMPGNTMHLTFETQRKAKSRDGVIETLDILISDEVGQRPYELYSGGEAFRLNFAVRVALSMLLARRAGARLQTLVIDEGFGTQDSRGRDGLIEAIRAIEPDFHTILVITHIAELKEMFPTRIDVVKELDGSRVFVN